MPPGLRGAKQENIMSGFTCLECSALRGFIPRFSVAWLPAFTLMIAAILPIPSFAAGKPPPELVKVRAAFVAAVKAKDIAAMEAVVAFPLANDVYQEPQTISKEAFSGKMSHYTALAGCLARQPLEADPDTAKTTKLWLVDCDGNEIFFGQRAGQWLHVKFANVNE